MSEPCIGVSAYFEFIVRAYLPPFSQKSGRTIFLKILYTPCLMIFAYVQAFEFIISSVLFVFILPHHVVKKDARSRLFI